MYNNEIHLTQSAEGENRIQTEATKAMNKKKSNSNQGSQQIEELELTSTKNNHEMRSV
jgi:hypothetical protein